MATTPNFAVGTQFLNRYRILMSRPLGSGGAGDVYIAMDEKLGRKCAIKFLSLSRIGDPNFTQTFENEIKELAALRHHNITNILDYETSGASNGPYYVMEFADGGDLTTFVKVFDDKDYLFLPRLLSGIAEGLRYIHSHGRLHFDIKPSNILFSDGAPKISDFGVIKKPENSAALTYVRTTRRFTHPELLKLLNYYDSKIPSHLLFNKYYFDFYSLGMSLAEVRGQFAECHRRQLDVLDELLTRLLEKEPYGTAGRYQSTAEIIRDIAKLDPLYLQPAGVSELAPAFVNTAPCRVPPFVNISLSQRMTDLMDCAAMQRLRLVPQLEGVQVVYPGATHTRFEHSLGTYQQAREILTSLLAVPRVNFVLRKEDILVGLFSALVNNIGAYPFTHVLEELGDRWPLKREQLKLAILNDELDSLGTDLCSIVGKVVALSEVREVVKRQLVIGSSNRMELLHSVLHGTLGADRLDYLERDSVHCGVPYGLMGDKERLYASIVLDPGRWCTAITKKGLASGQSFVMALCIMFSEVYWHHTVRAVATMMKAGVTTVLESLSTFDEVRRVALDSDEQQFLRWLHDHASVAGQALLRPLMMRDKRMLYKRVFTLRLRFLPQPHSDAPQEERAWSRLENSRGDLAAIIKVLAPVIGRVLKTKVEEEDVLVDIPDLTHDRLENINVLYPGWDEGSVKPYPITVIGQFPEDLLFNFSRYVKKARIFVNPRLIAENSSKRGKLGRALLSELSS